MAPRKMPMNKLGRTAKYYRTHPEARRKKLETTKKINQRPEQRKKRSELVRERRKRGMYGKGGKDLSHENGRLVARSPKKNRGNKKNSPGDRRARGGKKKKK